MQDNPYRLENQKCPLVTKGAFLRASGSIVVGSLSIDARDPGDAPHTSKDVMLGIPEAKI
jgi:hypothetical protein